MKTAIVVLSILLPIQIFAQSHPIDAPKPEQFNFWIGQWDVNLRVIQDDNTWQDKLKSEARIYPVVGGKGILELWDHDVDGIIGYSFRYYNTRTDEWDLWLNWPSKNKSGTSGLNGSFRHGRGEFFSRDQINDSTEVISRYSFNDITPVSIRWDDAYSRDGGKTWANNWIMEFTRRAETAPPLNFESARLTQYEGKRCDLEAFDVLKQLEGAYITSGNKELKLLQILDGCSLIGLIDEEALFTLTYNTYAGLYELGYFDSSYTEMDFFYGELKEGTVFELQTITGATRIAKIDISTGFRFSVEYNNSLKQYEFIRQ